MLFIHTHTLALPQNTNTLNFAPELWMVAVNEYVKEFLSLLKAFQVSSRLNVLKKAHGLENLLILFMIWSEILIGMKRTTPTLTSTTTSGNSKATDVQKICQRGVTNTSHSQLATCVPK